MATVQGVNVVDPLDLFLGERGQEAAREAAELQAGAAGRGVGVITAGQEAALQQISPFQLGGPEAFQQMQALAGMGGEFQLQETPGQRFMRERQRRGMLRSAAATGGLGGGNIRTELAAQGAGFGAGDIQTQFGQLAGLTGVGLGAAQQAAGLGIAGGTNIADLFRAQGAARASGLAGVAQAQAQGRQNLIAAGTAAGQAYASRNQ